MEKIQSLSMAHLLRKFRKQKEAAENDKFEKPAVRLFNVNEGHISDHYIIKNYLGKGSFSTVKLGTDKRTNTDVAVKIIAKHNIDVKVESLKTEVRILMNVKHPNIVNLIDVYEDEQHVYLVMELMNGGELFERICNEFPNGYSEQQSSVLIRKIIEAVAYLHEKGILHRDLKPENLLFSGPEQDNSEIKISDFGLAKIWSGDMLVKTACGSPNYVAPEVLQNQLNGYSFACDMWSIGVILYVLLCGFCPFFDESTPALFASILKGNYSFPSPYWDHISMEAKDLCSKLLITNPDERYTPQQALDHPWIKANAHTTPIHEITHNIQKFASQRSAASFNLQSAD